MKKYRVSVPYYVTVFVDVEAANEREAIKIGTGKIDPVLCNNCCSEGMELGEYTGDEITAEEIKA